MKYLPDTTFLRALYRRQFNSERAIAFRERIDGALRITGLLQFEFVQSVHLQVNRHRHRPKEGIAEGEAVAMLAAFESDFASGTIRLHGFDWAQLQPVAMRLVEKHTIATGTRAFDILHVATALHLGAREFLTFDSRQRLLAESEGLVVPL
ncbi:MAG: PIN domain-containing protein [Chthoniobacteraceae bacterium]